MNSLLNILNRETDLNDDNVILSYNGPFFEGVISNVGKMIREELVDDSPAIRKLFAVFIEASQNIFYYSSSQILHKDKYYGVGSILIYKTPIGFKLCCGNQIDEKYVDELYQSCTLINSLDKDGLRELKRKVRKTDAESMRSRGAGIGLIQIGIHSEKPLQFEFTRVDDQKHFFNLAVEI